MQKQILLVGPVPPQIGGIEFFVDALLRSPLQEWFTIRHFNISKPKSRLGVQFDSPMGYARSFRRSFKNSFFSFGYSLIYFIRYLFLIPSRSIGLVHLHSSSYMSFWEKCAYLDAAKLFGKKVVIHIHGSAFDRFIQESNSWARKRIIRHLNSCDRVVALSERWKTFFLNYLPAGKIAVIENGIDLSPYRDLQPQPAEIPTVIFLGELCNRKGLYDLLPAFKRVRESLPEARCLLIGPGELDKARETAAQLGLSTSVQITGPKWGEDKARLMIQGWCIALPSYAEVFPMSLLEGFAAGLPAVSTTVGGIPDFIHEGVNGFLVPPGDQEALANALLRVLSDQDVQQKIARTNRELAWNRYDISFCASRIRQLYQEVLLDSDTLTENIIQQ